LQPDHDLDVAKDSADGSQSKKARFQEPGCHERDLVLRVNSLQHIASVLLLSLCASTVPAQSATVQKATAALEWHQQAVKIHYEALPVGEHSLAKLKVGRRWRLGASHDPSTLVAMSPILVGDAWIAPGRYRVQLYRDTETACTLVAEGAEHAVGKADLIRMNGTIAALPMATPQLAIDLRKQGKESFGNQQAEVEIRFGNEGWRGSFLVLGSKSTALAGFRLVTFHVPAASLQSGPVPIATLHRGGDSGASWNVLLDQDSVVLMPWLPLPETNFAAIPPPEPSAVIAGKVIRSELALDRPIEVLELREAAIANGNLSIVVAYGNMRVECILPEPKVADPEPKTPAPKAKGMVGGK
jgi:hypothetical protein